MSASWSDRWRWTILASALLLGLPSVILWVSGVHVHPLVAALVYGAGILGSAFLLSWAAEVAQLDISASLAIAILAFLTVLPEYAIEAVLAWDAGASFNVATGAVTAETQRVAANVTGANRMLVGLGWSVVILVYWFRHREPLAMRGRIGSELTFLTVATLLTFALFFMQEIHYAVAGLLIGVYVLYLWVSSSKAVEEPELMGVAAQLASLPTRWRRTTVIALFVFAAAVILLAADPFVEALVEAGHGLGIDEFILIQWIAPVASETPEVVVAVLFAFRSNPALGLAVLIASEVNKFTLLIGSMVVVFSLSAGELLHFPLDQRQGVEFLLTTAVSLFGLLLIAPRTVGWRTGAVLLGTFVAHLFFPSAEHRLWIAYAYFGMAAMLVILDWRRIVKLVRE